MQPGAIPSRGIPDRGLPTRAYPVGPAGSFTSNAKQVGAIPERGIPTGAIPLRGIPVNGSGAFTSNAEQVGAIPKRGVPIGSIPLRGIPIYGYEEIIIAVPSPSGGGTSIAARKYAKGYIQRKELNEIVDIITIIASSGLLDD